jgi:hypothetical protein
LSCQNGKILERGNGFCSQVTSIFLLFILTMKMNHMNENFRCFWMDDNCYVTLHYITLLTSKKLERRGECKICVKNIIRDLQASKSFWFGSFSKLLVPSVEKPSPSNPLIHFSDSKNAVSRHSAFFYGKSKKINIFSTF